MKKNRELLYPDGRGTPKIWLIMKLSFLMLFVILWQVSASGYSQETKLKLDVRGASVKEVFKAIKAQSQFTFIYSDDDISSIHPISINANEVSVETVLNQCLENSGLTYEVQDNVIIIKPAPKDIQQETVTISGTVTDEKGDPVPGVNIILLEYNTGTITNGDGMYEIRVPNGEGTLSFTFIGFEKKVVSISGRTEINVVLKTQVSELDDVVVTGYGKRNKKSYTGSAVTVSGEELIQVSNDNVLTSLSIIDPSFVRLENNEMGSDPNALPEFQMRGSSSIPGLEQEYQGNPNMPTFILDGFEVGVTTIFDLDPHRIASITLLKDASATAIYGSRGANGVVVIETKAPEAGKVQVSYNFDLAVTAPDLTDYDLLNAEEKLQLEKDAGFFTSDNALVDVLEDYEYEYNEKLKLVQQGYDTYWLAKPLETAFAQKHSLLLEGGDKSFRYGLDMKYNTNNGVMKESGRDRYGMGVTLQYIVDNFTFKNRLTYENVISRNSPYGSFSQYALKNPYFPYKDDQGNYIYDIDKITTFGRTEINPLYNTTLNTIDESAHKQFINNFSIDWQISKSSMLRGSFSIHQKTTSKDVFKPAKHTDFAGYSGDDIYRKGRYVAGNGESVGYEGSLVYSFVKTIDKHMVYVNLGGNIQEDQYEDYTITAEGFPNEDANTLAFAKQYLKDGRPQGSEYTSRLIGTLGAFNYSFDNRYLLDLSYRVDGSSRFGADSRWAPFWSTGLGWNIHNESFFHSSDLVNQLKLRASYGLTGSQDYNPYQAITTYEYYNDTRYHYGYGSTMKALGNSNLKWQRTIQANLGLDATLFKNRLMLNANIYRNVSKDVLTPVTLPGSLGFTTYMENLGEIENKGLEAKMNLFLIRNKRKNITWSVSASAVHNINTLNKLSNSLKAINDEKDDLLDGTSGDLNKPVVRYMEGESANTIWAVRSLGIDPATGKEVFLTKEGVKTFKWNAKDQVPVGVTDPDLRGSFGTFAKYKNWSLNMVFMYRLGGQNYNQTLVDRVENANKRDNVDRRVFEDRWKEPGDVTFFKDVKDNNQTKPTSRFVEDYSYLNLGSLNLSYEFDVEKLKKVGLKRFKASFYMNDVFRTSTVKIERGINYPFARSFSFALQVKL